MVRSALLFTITLSFAATGCTSEEERAAEARAVTDQQAAEALAAGAAAGQDGEAARGHFERALELDPTLREAAAALAHLHLAAGRNAEAKASAEAAIAIEVQPEELTVLARAQVELGDDAAALAALGRALELDATLPLWPEIGRLSERLGDRDRAIAAFRSATEASADDWRSWERLGTLSIEAGDAEGGKAALMQARNRAPWQGPERAELNARLAEIEGVAVEAMVRLDDTIYRLRNPHISQVTGIRPAALRPEDAPDTSSAMVVPTP